MKPTTFRLTEEQRDDLDELVEDRDDLDNRSQAIRYAVVHHLLGDDSSGVDA